MIKFLKTLYARQTSQVLMQSTMADYQYELVVVEAQAAYAIKMAEFYREGIKRLRVQLTKEVI